MKKKKKTRDLSEEICDDLDGRVQGGGDSIVGEIKFDF